MEEVWKVYAGNLSPVAVAEPFSAYSARELLAAGLGRPGLLLERRLEIFVDESSPSPSRASLLRRTLCFTLGQPHRALASYFLYIYLVLDGENFLRCIYCLFNSGSWTRSTW